MPQYPYDYSDQPRPVQSPPQLYIVDHSTPQSNKKTADLMIRPFPTTNWDNVGLYDIELEVSLENFPQV